MPKLAKAQQRLQNALEFFDRHRAAMVKDAPPGSEEEYGNTFAWIREPAYCWPEAYGDFAPATVRAATAKGLLEQSGTRPAWRITPAGRAALAKAGES